MDERYEVTVKDGQIELPQEVVELFDQVRSIDSTIKALKEQKDAIEKPLKAAMQKYGIDSFKCDYMTATRVKKSFTETVNIERMKDDGIYEKYRMQMPKAGYVSIRYKKVK